jgi:hypothetical protein
MLSPLPRRSGWAYCFAHSPSRISLPRKGRRVGLRIVLFEACSTFTRVTACTLALSPIRDTHSEGFSYFVTSIAAPAASGWSVCRVGLAPTGKRRLVTAHTQGGLYEAPARAGEHSTSIAGNKAISSRLIITKKRKTLDRRDSRSALAVNKLYQLVNDEFLFTDYAFYQISNRYNSDQFALINNGKVANSLLSHNGHAFFHSLIKVSV